MKNYSLIMMLVISMTASAQNFQVHYDFGKGRKYITTTFEMYKDDQWGNTYYFIDMDYNSGKGNDPSLAYMELARCFTLGKSPLSFQIEYDGGLFFVPNENGNSAFAINNAFLTGLNYGWISHDTKKSLNFQVLYKYISGKNPVSFQLTGVWNLNFFKDKLTLCGFADFWREDNINQYNANNELLNLPTKTKFVFASEPQIWYNITPHLSIGSETEFGVNFGSVDGLKLCPTVATKWNF